MVSRNFSHSWHMCPPRQQSNCFNNKINPQGCGENSDTYNFYFPPLWGQEVVKRCCLCVSVSVKTTSKVLVVLSTFHLKKTMSGKIWHLENFRFFSNWVQMSYWWQNMDVYMDGRMVPSQIMPFQSRLWQLRIGEMVIDFMCKIFHLIPFQQKP